MLKDALKEVTGLFDRRFLLNVFFPCLIFCGLLTVVVIVGAGGDLIEKAGAWSKQDVGIQILQIVGFLSLITVFAEIVDSQLPTIIRFYEGYSPMCGCLRKIGRNFHQMKLEELSKNRDDYELIYLHYPLPTQSEEVMATRLGNILKNSERYPRDRYNLDAVLIWSRLYYLFPDRFVQIVAEIKSSIDFMLVVSTLSAIFAIVGGVYLVLVRASGWLFLLCFWGGLVTAWLAYRGALASAVIYAQQIKTGFDLYRQELLKQMHLKLPDNLKDEKELWKIVDDFLYRNIPITGKYTNSSLEKSSKILVISNSVRKNS